MKLVLFDLDGVLINAKDIHYRALNIALGDEYAISEEDHRNVYDGRKTFQKLEILTERKGLRSLVDDRSRGRMGGYVADRVRGKTPEKRGKRRSGCIRC